MSTPENKRHTFVICAYKESPFLEECIQSLKKQTVKSEIIMATATPNAFVRAMAEKYEIPLFVNIGETGITQDWNFAYSQADTDYVTIAHQDDLYGKHYTETLLKMTENVEKPLIFFTDYYELRNGRIVKSNTLLRIKRFLLLPLRPRFAWESRFIRRRVLSMGSSICCPSVAFARNNLPNPVFMNHFRTDEDWEAWERISRLEGSFIYCRRPLVCHRIHEDSETTGAIKETGRSAEDYEMFCKFWPDWIAKLLVKLYSKSEKSNTL
ncbi:MAG: glycosyltransferase [Butyrivibrio sp.]|nr:glycosyltransferase [Butyrivibrio sp.]